MNILHVFDFFSPHGGGTVSVLYQLTQTLAQRGHQVSLYTSDYKLDRRYIESMIGVKVHLFHCISRLGGFFVMPEMVKAVRDNLRDYDVIHLHCARSFQNIVIYHYATRYNIPYIVDDRGSLPRAPGGYGRGIRWFLKWLFDICWGYRILRDATGLVTENNYGAFEYKNYFVDNLKITTIPLSFPVETFTNLPELGLFRHKYGIKDARIIMFLGRIHYIKGIDFLLKSFHQLSLLRDDIRLVIVGPDDGYQDNLKKLAEKLRITNLILYTGFLDGQDKLAALVDADVVVQPSRYENAAWAPVEAILCGTPVVVTRGSGSGEDVSRMGGGYLVEYGNRSEMVQTLQKILDDPVKAREKIARAKEYIISNRQINTIVSEYEELYRRCIDVNPTSRRDK